LRFVGWINQTETDWFKARTAAIRAVKMQLEKQGFGMPEPIYRVRFDSGSPLQIARMHHGDPINDQAGKVQSPSLHENADVSVENDIEEKVKDERENSNAEDMLDSRRPVE
jgi:hypothetical protein